MYIKRKNIDQLLQYSLLNCYPMDQRILKLQMALAKRTTMAKIAHSHKLIFKCPKRPILWMLNLIQIGKHILKTNKIAVNIKTLAYQGIFVPCPTINIPSSYHSFSCCSSSWTFCLILFKHFSVYFIFPISCPSIDGFNCVCLTSDMLYTKICCASLWRV